MEEYEVKDLYSRKAIPDIQIDGCSFYKTKEETDDFFEYKLMASITNTGHTMCDTYKLNFYINNPFSVIFHINQWKTNIHLRFWKIIE